MKSEQARLLRGACLALMLAASESHARDCDAAHAVALDIVAGETLDGKPAAGSEQLEQSVIAELGASQIAVCASAGAGSLARVQIRAMLPAWQRASIRLESAHSPALERDLDVSKLPPEARALAIASATDELIRAALAESAMASADTAPSPVESNGAQPRPVEPDRTAPDPDALGPTHLEPAPLVELGLAAAGSSYFGQREALEAELAARYWLLPRLPIGARLGIGQRRSRPPERGDVQPDGDVHAALGAGFALWTAPGVFDLIGEAGVLLSRVGFDERMRLEAPGFFRDGFTDDVTSFTDANPIRVRRADPGDQPLDHGWALAGSLGVEGRARTGPVGFSLALAGLVPFVPARSDWGNQTSLDTFGVQLRAAAWVLLGEVQSP